MIDIESERHAINLNVGMPLEIRIHERAWILHARFSCPWCRARMVHVGMSPDLRIDSDRLADVCRRYHVIRLELFGSQARGDARPDSDVDLLVSFAIAYHSVRDQLPVMLQHIRMIVEQRQRAGGYE